MFDDVLEMIDEFEQGLADVGDPVFALGPLRDRWPDVVQNHLDFNIHPLPLKPATLRYGGFRIPPQPSYMLRTGELRDSLKYGFAPLPDGGEFGAVNPPPYAGYVEDRLNNDHGRSMVPNVSEWGDVVMDEIDKLLPR